MATVKEMKATARPKSGKGAARAERRAGRVPGVIYGNNLPPVTISVDDAELRQRILAGRFLTTIYDVDLECSKTTESGLLMVGGNVINSTTEYAPEDTWAGIVLKPGSPAEGTIVLQLDDPKMPTCLEFLDQMIGFGEPTLEPIEGTLELGP